MKIRDINWCQIKNRIGRWQKSEVHAGQVKYELIADVDNPFVITEFTVDFEDETVSDGWRDSLYGSGEVVSLTPEERAEAEQMIKDCKLSAEEYKVGDTLVNGDKKIRIKSVIHKPATNGKITTYYNIRYLAPKDLTGAVVHSVEQKELDDFIRI